MKRRGERVNLFKLLLKPGKENILGAKSTRGVAIRENHKMRHEHLIG